MTRLFRYSNGRCVVQMMTYEIDSLRHIQVRSFSPSTSSNIPNRNSGSEAFKEMFGLPFSVSPEQALQKFQSWAKNEQGLNSFLMNPNSAKISAVYTPVWSFTINIRFVLSVPPDPKNPSRTRKRLDWKPDLFQEAYGSNQSVIHLPGLSSYAGHTYRRSVIDPLHNSSLIFMGEDVVPFGGWMMRDMKMGNTILPVSPDPWNTSRGRAFAVVKNHLEQLSNAASNLPSPDHSVQVQTEIVSHRRVYIPTYVIDYKVFPNMQFQAFVSGCDAVADVSGVSHKVFADNSDFLKPQDLHSFYNSAASFAEKGTSLGRQLGFGNRELGTIIVLVLQGAFGLLARLLYRIPLVGAFVGFVIGYRKIVQPWMDSRSASAQWERLREYEATMKVDITDDFADSGTAQRFFQSNRDHILRNLSGKESHTRGDYDWYQEWEKWARQQWEQQSRQQTSSGRQYQQQQQQRAFRQEAKTEYQWDFDPSDPCV